MHFLDVAVPEDHAYLYPIGDVHFGDRSFGKRGLAKLKGYLNWVADTPNARIMLMGDLYNAASRVSKTSPFETNPDEYESAIELFLPYSQKIIGAIEGNHERRLRDLFGASLALQHFCSRLGVPYCGASCLIRLRVGKRPEKDWYWQTYHVYAHHTTGGGATLGGAMNRVTKLQDIMQGVDVYLGAHNHQLANGVRAVYFPGRLGPEQRRVHYVDCGSYLDWEGSYAEDMMCAPGKLGSPRIRFDGKRDEHDVHTSL